MIFICHIFFLYMSFRKFSDVYFIRQHWVSFILNFYLTKVISFVVYLFFSLVRGLTVVIFVFTHGVRMGGWVGGEKMFVRAVSPKPYGVGSSYLVGTLVRGCRCATSWCDLDLTFDLAVVTLTYKISSGLYLGNRKVYEVVTR